MSESYMAKAVEYFLWFLTAAFVLAVFYDIWLWAYDQPVHYSPHRYWLLMPSILSGFTAGCGALVIRMRPDK